MHMGKRRKGGESNHEPDLTPDIKTSVLIAVSISLIVLGAANTYLSLNSVTNDFRLYGFGDHRKFRYSFFIVTLFNTFAIFVVHRIRMKSSIFSTAEGHTTTTEIIRITPTQMFQRSSQRDLLVGRIFWTVAVWIVAGPPWGIQSSALTLNNHETVHLKGVQAILRGSTPYIDAASSQYGPLQQFASVIFIKLTGQESVAGMREFWTLTNFIGLLLVVHIVLVLFPPRVATLINATLFVSPAFWFFQISHTGFDGFFGWANPMRNLGALAAVVLMTRTRSEDRLDNRTRWIVSALLGVLAGALALVAQENLMFVLGTLSVTSLFYLVAGRLTRNLILHQLVFLTTACGVFAIYLFPYMLRGQLFEFVRNYLLVPLAVNKGYANFDWQLIDNDCCRQNLQSTPLFLFALIVSVIGGVVCAIKVLKLGNERDNQPAQWWYSVLAIWVAWVLVLSVTLTSMGADRIKSAVSLLPIWLIPTICLLVVEHRTSFVRTLSTIVIFGLVATQSVAINQSVLPIEAIKDISMSLSVRVFGFLPQDNESRTSVFKYAPQFSEDDFDSVVGWMATLPKDEVLIDQIVQPVLGDELGAYYFFADLEPFELPFSEEMMAITDELDGANLRSVADPSRELCGIVTSDIQSSLVDSARNRGRFILASSTKVEGVSLFYLRNQLCN